jgi:phosphopantetheine adenylyltransferase
VNGGRGIIDIIVDYSRARERFNRAEKRIIGLTSDNFFQHQYTIKILGISTYLLTRNVFENIYYNKYIIIKIFQVKNFRSVDKSKFFSK